MDDTPRMPSVDVVVNVTGVVPDRGTSGDPNYVNNVNGSNPTCP